MRDSPAPHGSAAAPAPSSAPATQDLTAPPLRRRLAAWLYEGVLLFGVVIPAGLLFSVATDMRHGLAHRSAFVAFLFVVLGAYFVFFWSRGQTLAMKTWRLRLVDRHGRRLTAGRAAIRYVFSYVWLLPPLATFATHRVAVGPVLTLVLGWVAVWALLSRFHPQRQFWHDALAGTRLVDAPPVARR